MMIPKDNFAIAIENSVVSYLTGELVRKFYPDTDDRYLNWNARDSDYYYCLKNNKWTCLSRISKDLPEERYTYVEFRNLLRGESQEKLYPIPRQDLYPIY